MMCAVLQSSPCDRFVKSGCTSRPANDVSHLDASAAPGIMYAILPIATNNVCKLNA